MKKYLLIILALLLFSCETSNEEIAVTEENLEFYPINKITGDNDVIYEKFLYSNNKPNHYLDHRHYEAGVYRWRGFEFRYKDKEKIQDVYFKIFNTNGDPDMLEESDGNIYGEKELHSTFTYDNSNRIIKLEKFIHGREKLLFEYQNGRIVLIKLETNTWVEFKHISNFHIEYDNRGNVKNVRRVYLPSGEEETYQFQYDENKNPHFAYFKNFGPISFVEGNILLNIVSSLSPNNPVGDLEHKKAVSYDYNEGGYPIIEYYEYYDKLNTHKIYYKN